MESSQTKQLLETYYRGWEDAISDDFRFITDNMTEPNVKVGKETYIKIIERFSRVYQTMRVKRMIVEGENASVIANYDYVFPNGKHISGDVAEFWTAKNGKLDSLHIFLTP